MTLDVFRLGVKLMASLEPAVTHAAKGCLKSQSCAFVTAGSDDAIQQSIWVFIS
jgi:hypothetical protein